MIPFTKVYRMRPISGESEWSVVMGLTPMPDLDGLWMFRASLTHPETIVRGKVFEGKDGKITVVGVDGRYIFEPLTLENWEDMKDDVSGFEIIRRALTTDAMLQGWYFDEFAHDGSGNEFTQGEILRRLQDQVVSK